MSEVKMRVKKKLTNLEPIKQNIFNAKTEKERKMWQEVLKALEAKK